MPYSPAIVANAVLHRAKERGLSVSHLKLQKLVFFTHAWSLAIEGVPAVDERPEAWEYGPVFNSLYYRLKGSGHDAITALIETVDAQTNAFAALIPSPVDATFWRILDQVMDRYGSFTPSQLSTLSHEAGGPWEQARNSKQAVISDESVRQFYRGMLP
ncbi:Panacea domain-containing protein [Roseateles sp.]|uniref:Panacea domain-containing protein n=1 Tax=Roseateles sp. TaxID=1971397 RepID=UPI002F4194ED